MTPVQKAFSWFVAIPVTILALAFALDNRSDIDLGLWPLPYRITVPVYAAVLGAVVLGFLSGGLVAWLQGGRIRRLARRQRHRVDQLERELAKTKLAGRHETPSAPSDPPRIAAAGR